MKLLLTGDLHIGRSSSRLPEGMARREFLAATAWERIVDLTIDEYCRAVCLSGDIADQENRFWEAIEPLEDGIRRLGEVGIRTLAEAAHPFIDEVSALAREVNGDAAAIIEALESGQVTRWRSKSTERLREYFEESGYLPEQEPLPRDQIRVRVLAAVGDALAAGRLDLRHARLVELDSRHLAITGCARSDRVPTRHRNKAHAHESRCC